MESVAPLDAPKVLPLSALMGGEGNAGVKKTLCDICSTHTTRKLHPRSGAVLMPCHQHDFVLSPRGQNRRRHVDENGGFPSLDYLGITRGGV